MGSNLASWWYIDDGQLEPILTGLLAQVWWVGAGAAFLSGVLHALGPGHGKTLVGAYLMSGQGRVRDAVALGVSVAAMHTGSVQLLGLASYWGQDLLFTPGVAGAFRLVSALAVIAVGSWGLWRTTRRTVRGTPVLAGGHHRAHHPHHAEEGAPLSRAGILAIATSGGLVPSPAAFVLLATAIALGRVGYGISLVAAFGLGLATALTAVGAIAVISRDRLMSQRLGASERLLAALPIAGNCVILLGGIGLAVLAAQEVS